MESPEQLYSKAMRCFSKENVSEAQVLLEKALGLNDRYADALEALGVIYQRQGKTPEAIGLFKKLAAVDPNNIMAHTNLSQIYVGQGRIQEAEAEQAEARRLTWKLELKERKSAHPASSVNDRIERYKKVVELASKDVLGYFSLGSAYAEAGQWGEAEAVFRKAVTVDPQHSSSYLGLGRVLQEQGKIQEAVRIFEQGIPIAEQNGDMIPFKKMSARLKEIREKGSFGGVPNS